MPAILLRVAFNQGRMISDDLYGA